MSRYYVSFSTLGRQGFDDLTYSDFRSVLTMNLLLGKTKHL